MENVFENVKFGDRFRTRDGRPAVYLSTEHHGSVDDKYNPPFVIINCAVEHHIRYMDGSEKFFHEICHYTENGKWNKWNPEDDDLDIVSRWVEPIDEIKLDKMINESSETYSKYAYRQMDYNAELADIKVDGYIEGFKKGYITAKGE